ncbi:MAG: sialic acid TRAP transporter substrate-binding protein SiaP [Methylobacteriaceae bacterium]|jgi:tripartite ATP-independent transporter DctP family solute receptor|nr:sialic acid TRAP transporter substrate-binding protein SiaP [Methylobacteriaceae bacterium]
MKHLTYLSAGLFAAGLLCGASAPLQAAPVELIYTLNAPGTDTQGGGMRVFKEVVEKVSNGEITVLTYDSASLFKQEQELAAVKSGQADIAVISAPWFTGASPWVSMFAAGYLFKDAAHMNAVLNGEIGKQVFERILKDQGVRPLGAEYFGTRQINMVEDKPIRTPEDLKGVNLRMPNSDAWLFLGKAMGANPTPITFAEIYLALQTKAIDGQENPLPTDRSSKFYEVTKSISLTNHIVDSVWITINEAKWQSLTDQQKGWVMEGVKANLDYCYETNTKIEAEIIDFFKSQGLKIYEADLDAFSSHVMEQYLKSDYSKTWDMDLYKKIRDMAK